MIKLFKSFFTFHADFVTLSYFLLMNCIVMCIVHIICFVCKFFSLFPDTLTLFMDELLKLKYLLLLLLEACIFPVFSYLHSLLLQQVGIMCFFHHVLTAICKGLWLVGWAHLGSTRRKCIQYSMIDSSVISLRGRKIRF